MAAATPVTAIVRTYAVQTTAEKGHHRRHVRDRPSVAARGFMLYRGAWLSRSRPGGLSDSVAHLERTLASYDIEA